MLQSEQFRLTAASISFPSSATAARPCEASMQ